MSEVHIKYGNSKNKKKVFFTDSPIGVHPRKNGGMVASRAFLKETATNAKPKLHVKRGDTVMVISGKDKGKTGKVIAVIPKKGKLIIEGINKIKRHTKPQGMGRAGEIIEKEAPIFSSKVMLFDTTKNKPTRIGHKILSSGKKVRISRLTGEQID